MNVVPMRRCLEKDDLDELLSATEGTLNVVAEAPARGGVAAVIAAEESDEEPSDDEEKSEEGYEEERDEDENNIGMLIYLIIM